MITKLKMKCYNTILIEVAKISTLYSGKADKYQYVTGEEILPFYQSRMTEPAKFTYFPLGETFKKQIKKIE